MEQLEEDLAQRGGKKGKANSENLPKGPARHELSGFRGVVTSVKFHPSISVIVASGEDGTVKVHIIRVAAFRIESAAAVAVECLTASRRLGVAGLGLRERRLRAVPPRTYQRGTEHRL